MVTGLCVKFSANVRNSLAACGSHKCIEYDSLITQIDNAGIANSFPILVVLDGCPYARCKLLNSEILRFFRFFFWEKPASEKNTKSKRRSKDLGISMSLPGELQVSFRS